MTRAEQMYGIVKAWQQSGISKRFYAEQHNIKYATFQYWCKRNREQHSSERWSPFFAELTSSIGVAEAASPSSVVITLASGTRIEVR